MVTLTDWEVAFTKLNFKLGNDIWGARVEGDGLGGLKIRIFVNEEKFIEVVEKETSGTLCNMPIIYEVYKQEDYALKLKRYEQLETTT